jgi:hypothetical protein
MTLGSTPGSGSPLTPASAGADPTLARNMQTVATYPDYASAQRAVDFLSDEKFPVEKSAIVGTNLRLVENVLGRMTTGRAAAAGAASGAWFGLFIGLLFGIFASVNWFGVLIAAILIGAAWGAIFGATAHAMTRGQRDFTSRSTLAASEYAVNVESDYVEQARQLLTRLNWRTNNPS